MGCVAQRYNDTTSKLLCLYDYGRVAYLQCGTCLRAQRAQRGQDGWAEVCAVVEGGADAAHVVGECGWSIKRPSAECWEAVPQLQLQSPVVGVVPHTKRCFGIMITYK